MKEEKKYLVGNKIGIARKLVSKSGQEYFKGVLENGTKFTMIPNYEAFGDEYAVMQYEQNTFSVTGKVIPKRRKKRKNSQGRERA